MDYNFWLNTRSGLDANLDRRHTLVWRNVVTNVVIAVRCNSRRGATMPITVECGGCTKRFRANDQHAGKRGKCPSCGAVIHVPEPTPPPPSSSTLARLLDEEMIPSAALSKCPSCSQALPAGAALCVQCGHDLRTGEKLAVERDVDDEGPSSGRSERSGSLLGGMVSFGSSFAMGCLLSAVGAAIGAGVWFGVALGTGYEVGWIAIGLGFLSGAGMVLGYREENDLAGISAGAISILGILFAKWLIYVQVVEPIMIVAAALKDELGGELGSELEELSNISFASMFGPIDGLFILLAVATAYKIGNASPTD